MKERFGLDPQYPISRYVDGFTNAKVPDRAGEHDPAGKYVGNAGCTNPLFAGELRTGEDVCNLPAGPRTKELVFFGLIGGVPQTLLDGGPSWTKIVGQNPAAYDLAGLDPHMIPSIVPRAGLPPPAARGDNGPDPIHGREWDTKGRDLQYACTFPLPAPRQCMPGDPACECGAPEVALPLCGNGTEQVRGKAYPTPRELRVAQALGDQAVVGSICAADPKAAYAPMLGAFADRFAPRLAR
jgi:hypothetical protein